MELEDRGVGKRLFRIEVVATALGLALLPAMPAAASEMIVPEHCRVPYHLIEDLANAALLTVHAFKNGVRDAALKDGVQTIPWLGGRFSNAERMLGKKLISALQV